MGVAIKHVAKHCFANAVFQHYCVPSSWEIRRVRLSNLRIHRVGLEISEISLRQRCSGKEKVTANILPEQRVDRKMQQNWGDYVYAPTPALIRKEASHGLYAFVTR